MLKNLFGFFLILFSILLGIILSGGNVIAYINLSAFIIIFGCSASVVIIIYGFKGFVFLYSLMRISIRSENEKQNIEIMNLLIDFSSRARKDGLLVLEKSIDVIKEPFLKKGITLLIDGVDADILRELLEIDTNAMIERHTYNRKILKLLVAVSPAFGLIGTIIALVVMLSNLSEIDAGVIGSGMATAIITTFYGALLANAFWGPLDERLENMTYNESLTKEVVMEGIISIQNGDHPRVVLEKLLSYYPKSFHSNIKKI